MSSHAESNRIDRRRGAVTCLEIFIPLPWQPAAMAMPPRPRRTFIIPSQPVNAFSAAAAHYGVAD